MTSCWADARDRSIATLAMLHVGIEPAVLSLLAETGAMPPGAAGWVVGAGQVGMSAGALMCWRSTLAVRRSIAVAAALLGTVASLTLAFADGLGGVLMLRLLLGATMGFLLTRATAMAARDRPQRAIGVILLGQQLLAAAVMVALPLIAALWSASVALIALAAAPLLVGLLVQGEPARSPPAASRREMLDAPDGMAYLAATALLIAITLMVWSYIGVVGAVVGVNGGAAAIAISVASLASAPAALLALLTTPRHPPWRVALICGCGMVSPLLLPEGSGLAGYVTAMALFNATSTFATIRFLGWAMERCPGVRGRRSVVLVQCVASASGGPLGAIAVQLGGLTALAALAMLLSTAAVCAMLTLRGRLGGIAAPHLSPAL